MDLRDFRLLARTTAKILAAIRCTIGITASVRPSLAVTPWVGAAESRRSSVQVLGRALAGRDLALGAGAILAESDLALAKLVALGAFADGVDFLATLRAFKQLPRVGRVVVLGSTFGALATGLVVAKLLVSDSQQSTGTQG